MDSSGIFGNERLLDVPVIEHVDRTISFAC
jgi:hypothetical protein